MPLTSKFVERVTKIFPRHPVIVDGKISVQNVRYHLDQAYTLLYLLADELSAHLECEDDCDELDEQTLIAVYDAWYEIMAAADGVVDQAWRFDRKARELANNAAEIRQPRPSEPAERLKAMEKLSSLIAIGEHLPSPPASVGAKRGASRK